jgi:hypothetical protein
MGIVRKRVGIYSPIINIGICVVLIGLVAITLFGNDIIRLLPEGTEINLSSFTGYLPMNDEGVPNGVISYVTESGTRIEPQAIVLLVLIFVAAISVVLSALSLFLGKEMGRKAVSLIVALVALAAIGLFIYSYGIAMNGDLWANISGFFASVFTIGLQGSVAEGAFGGFAVFTTYILIAGLGISSFVASLINK